MTIAGMLGVIEERGTRADNARANHWADCGRFSALFALYLRIEGN